MKNKSQNIIIAILILMLTVGVFYTTFGSSVGISVSCNEKKIIGFERVPPPLLYIVEVKECDVQLTASVDNTVICTKSVSIFTTEKSVIPCDELKNSFNKTITINVDFFKDGKQIGSDSKSLIYDKK